MGGDIETEKGRKFIKRLIIEGRPDLVWVSPECGPYSPMQRLNMRSEKQRADLKEKRRRAMLQYEGACEIARFCRSLGAHFVIELSERCEAWRFKIFQELKQDLTCEVGVCKGCQVGLKDQDGQLLGKGWKLMSTNHTLVRRMALKCTTNHVHGRCEGNKSRRQTAFYTPAFAKRVIEFLRAGESCVEVTLELFDGEIGQGFVGSATMVDHQDEKPQDGISSDFCFIMSPEERHQTMLRLKRIHTATGHCSKEYLIRALRKRSAKPDVIEMAKHFRCAVCEEQVRPQPRKRANLEELPTKRSRVQGDAGTWVDPETKEAHHFLIFVDEGSRLRVGTMLRPGRKMSLSGEDLTNFYETPNGNPCLGDPPPLDWIRLGLLWETMLTSTLRGRRSWLNTFLRNPIGRSRLLSGRSGPPRT